MTKNAKREDVKKKLSESLNYCNSHHIPAQELFESIADRTINNETCRYDAEERKREMMSLFPILLQAETSAMIPSIPMKPDILELDSKAFLELWLNKWISKFLSEWQSLPSDYVANPKKTVTDEALIHMVMDAKHAGSKERAYEWAAHHNLFMSAENIGGNLLEEYIYSKIKPYGWIWCRGKILTAIDFCNDECTAMFQVKNKTNTENSSGKGFRESCGAKAWNRMKAERRNGKIETYWPKLIEIVREGSTVDKPVPNDLVTEADYLDFVSNTVRNNPYLISEREGDL